MTALFFARKAQDRQSAHADKQQAEDERDGEQAAFVANDVADDIGAGDADGNNGGGNNGAEREPHTGDELGNYGDTALTPELAARGRNETCHFNGLAHGGPLGLVPD